MIMKSKDKSLVLCCYCCFICKRILFNLINLCNVISKFMKIFVKAKLENVKSSLKENTSAVC